MSATEFRKKPVIVKAQQFKRGHPIHRWPQGVLPRQCVDEDGCPYDGPPVIHTLEGVMQVSDGDWIVTGIKGERYPCKPGIFEATYEPADSPNAHDLALRLAEAVLVHPDACLVCYELARELQAAAGVKA